MTLVFRFLNVGHGSSIVVERQLNGQRFFGVVDSNASANTTPRALTVLRTLGADRLSFVCMTHPHRDHYSGLFDIVQAFEGRIGEFYSNPMGELVSNTKRFKKLVSHVANLAARTDGAKERKAAKEFAQILRWAGTSGVDWVECGGEFSELAPEGFGGVSIHSVLPPRRNVGSYVQRIETGSPLMFGSLDDNELSVALRFELGGSAVLLGGDGTVDNWRSRRKYIAKGGSAAKSAVVNLPHHGSAIDNPEDVTAQLFTDDGERFAITSANGTVHHPSIEVIERLSNDGISPYCTNLHASCGAAVRLLNPAPEVDPELARVLRELALEPNMAQPCQGDITVTIEETGEMNVMPEFNTFCPYRTAGVIAA